MSDQTVQQSVIAALVVNDARAALELYKTALGAVIGPVMDSPDGKVMHAEFTLGSTKLFINDDFPFMPRHPSEGTQSTGFYLNTDDCDAAYHRAVDAGMESLFEPADMFWGDRTASVKDIFGYTWTLSHHFKDMTKEEMDVARAEAGW